MAKTADKYLKTAPWSITEEGFDPAYGMVSESIFALGNEYMGSRASFDEGFSGKTMVGNYLNGVYEEAPIHHPNTYKGISTRTRFMVNTLNWFALNVQCEGETLDLATSQFSDFVRELDLKTGEVTRSFIWKTESGKQIRLTFRRLLSMEQPELACRRISMTALSADTEVELEPGLDFAPMHHALGRSPWKIRRQGGGAILGQTEKTEQYVFSTYDLTLPEDAETSATKSDMSVGTRISLGLKKDVEATLDQSVVNLAIKRSELSVDALWTDCEKRAAKIVSTSYDDALAASSAYWANVWATQDIEIFGDEEQQQGIRFCIFQLHQTYHGVDAANNVGAKGLTGEAYSGHTFWDTETYCLPFYLFSNTQAARNLLEYRYKTLPQAIEWATEQDCEGAFYPMSTIDGTESCGVWWHGNLEIHVSAAVAYGVWNYMKICDDRDFLYSKGMEMLLQIARFFASRGNWDPEGKYGFFGVMGPDEFHTFVNNNTYTNVIAQKTFEWAIEFYKQMQAECPEDCAKLVEKIGFKEDELAVWQEMKDKMKIIQDEETGVYEQHDGYFDLPHLDVDTIPMEDFPLYGNWSLPRIYRYDMIKQPDVLLLHFFFSNDYSLENKEANYAYYEPRCIHESSLSPSVHSILAAEVGRDEEAVEFSRFATRLDLDNYNRNTKEGLHTTSIAAAWMNIVYGFGGLRSDGPTLTLNPTCPAKWKGFSFKLDIKGSRLAVRIEDGICTMKIEAGDPLTVSVFGQEETIDATGIQKELTK